MVLMCYVMGDLYYFFDMIPETSTDCTGKNGRNNGIEFCPGLLAYFLFLSFETDSRSLDRQWCGARCEEELGLSTCGDLDQRDESLVPSTESRSWFCM